MTEPMMPRAEWEMLAAELALGVLEGDARAQAERMRMADPAFAAEVAAWQLRLAGIAGDVVPAEPPDTLWPAIERRITASAGRPAGSNVVPLRLLRTWQAGAGAMAAIAASLALVLVMQPPVAAPPPPLAAEPAPAIVAALVGSGEGAATRFAARYRPDAAELKVRAQDVPAGRLVPELWVIPADGVPRSLGLVAASGETRVRISPRLRALLIDGATLAVTLEEPAGIPHAAPSSAPIAVGQITTL